MSMIRYFILALFGGILLKIYDDIHDNNLYQTFNLTKYKHYVNAYLKSSYMLVFAILGTNFPFLFISHFLANVVTFIGSKTADYGPFEYSGMVAVLLLIPFIKWKNETHINRSIGFVVCTVICAYVLDILICEIEVEYSAKKLISRVFFTLFLVIFLLFKNFTVSNSIIASVLYVIGYMGTSCIFQVYLLSNKHHIKNKNRKKQKKMSALKCTH